jgi:hypothetical protein
MDAKTLDQYRDTGVMLNCQHLAAWAIAQAKGENPAPLEGHPRELPGFGCVIMCAACCAHVAKAAKTVTRGPVN